MSDNPYTDDEYDDTYEEVHGDEPARDQYTGDEVTDDTFFPSGVGGYLYPTGWGIWPADDAVDSEYEDDYDDRAAPVDTDEDDESWWDVGLIGGLLLVGVALFLFPEPATSAVGIGLITLSLIAWVVDWLA